MKMKRCLSAGILLVLTLQAALLVAGHLSDAAVDDSAATIRLPSEAQEQAVMAAAARPWKCCDVAVCTRSFPPICRCLDEVEHCAATCKSCVAAPLIPFLHVCNDPYRGDPGPICRPWNCCDSVVCTRSIPPICRCGDVVDQCAATCKSCVASTSDPSRYVCNDTYSGTPGPICAAEGK